MPREGLAQGLLPNLFHWKDESDSEMSDPIDIRQLRAFVSLAKQGSFTQAARELCLTQSAVSHSLKALEDDLACRLFDRVGKTIRLTVPGEQLLRYAEKIFHEMEGARTALKKLDNWGQAQLRICASTTICQYVLPGVLREFKKMFPQVMISIDPGDTLEAVELLREKRTDLAICLDPGNEGQFEFASLFTDELRFIVAPEHSWAQQGEVDRPSIPNQQYILYNKGTYTFQIIENYFRREKLDLNTVLELRSMEAIKELVKLGVGVSILAPWVTAKELADGSLKSFALGKKKLKRSWGILHWRKHGLTLAQSHFLTLCQRAGAKLQDH
jgi:LysR family transcriptional regulator, low CO2-responsive transcriptional regulator